MLSIFTKLTQRFTSKSPPVSDEGVASRGLIVNTTVWWIIASGAIVLTFVVGMVLKGDNSNSLSERQERAVGELVNEALTKSNTGQIDESEAVLVEAIDNAADSQERRALRINLAMIMQEHGRLDEAIAVYEASREQDGPMEVGLAAELAQTYEQKEDYINATKYYEHAYTIYGTRAEGEFNEETLDYYLQNMQRTKMIAEEQNE